MKEIGIIILLVQILIGLPFLMVNFKSYLSKAFEFNRVFEYKWTVNWKFISTDLFYHTWLSIGLLSAHLVSLLLFIHFKWLFCIF